MQIPHDREDGEHLLACVRGPTPVLPAEGDLADLLACAEAVIDGATPEAELSQARMNAAAVVGLQVWTRRPGRLADREVGRC